MGSVTTRNPQREFLLSVVAVLVLSGLDYQYRLSQSFSTWDRAPKGIVNHFWRGRE